MAGRTSVPLLYEGQRGCCGDVEPVLARQARIQPQPQWLVLWSYSYHDNFHVEMAEQLVLSVENLRLHDELMEEVELRQFGCEPCYRSWWKKVRIQKPVCHCRNCRTKYDALPRDKEYGVAEFVCQRCGHTFRGRGRVTTTSECYQCHAQCTVSRIIPGQGGIRRRTAQRHSCSECHGRGNCPNFGRIFHFSEVHDSTGSTASSVTAREFEVRLPLRGTFSAAESIPEEDGDFGEDS